MPASSPFFHRILGRILSFGSIQIAQMFLPLVALPYLSRVLGADAFGTIMYLNVIPVVAGFVLDWGFTLGGVRIVARNRTNTAALASIWMHGLLAKSLLVFPLLLLFWLYFALLPHPPFGALGICGAVAAGLARGFSPLWFYQGLADNSIRRLAICDVASSIVLLLLVFLLIQTPDDAELYLVLLGLCKGCTYAWLCLKTGKKYCLRPCLRKAIHMLWNMRIFFLGGLAGQAYSNWSHMGLGSILSVRDIGYFLVADKIIRALVSLSNPITQTLFPEICVMQSSEAVTARRRIQKITLTITAVVSLSVCLLLCIFARHILSLALGEEHSDAVQTLRLMSIALPLLSLNVILSSQILIPAGKEHVVTAAQSVAAAIAVPTTIFLAINTGLYGALWLPVFSEGCIFIILLFTFLRQIKK